MESSVDLSQALEVLGLSAVPSDPDELARIWWCRCA